MVFNQNFRQGFEAYMIKDNREAAMPLPVDESLFSAEACVCGTAEAYTGPCLIIRKKKL